MKHWHVFIGLMAMGLAGVIAGCAEGPDSGSGAGMTNGGGASLPMTVSLDPASGIGFVGKGDVQTAFGWNNKQLQTNAGGVTFAYIAEEEYSAVCEWTTGEGTKGEQTHDVAHSRSTSVAAQVGYDARVKSQITGFILNGYGAVSEDGAVPVVGGPCPGNPGTDGVWVSVELLSSSGGLYANYGGQGVLIWQ
jgi:hypothetical protein